MQTNDRRGEVLVLLLLPPDTLGSAEEEVPPFTRLCATKRRSTNDAAARTLANHGAAEDDRTEAPPFRRRCCPPPLMPFKDDGIIGSTSSSLAIIYSYREKRKYDGFTTVSSGLPHRPSPSSIRTERKENMMVSPISPAFLSFRWSDVSRKLRGGRWDVLKHQTPFVFYHPLQELHSMMNKQDEEIAL